MDLLLIESGGDNLAANYSRELADFIVYVIDVAGGDKVPRKGGPGITGSDLLVVNKVGLAPFSTLHFFFLVSSDFALEGLDLGEMDGLLRASTRAVNVDADLSPKTDLADAVGADLAVMERDAGRMRDGGPTIFAEVKNGKGVQEIVGLILSAWKSSGAYDISAERWAREGRKGSL